MNCVVGDAVRSIIEIVGAGVWASFLAGVGENVGLLPFGSSSTWSIGDLAAAPVAFEDFSRDLRNAKIARPKKIKTTTVAIARIRRRRLSPRVHPLQGPPRLLLLVVVSSNSEAHPRTFIAEVSSPWLAISVSGVLKRAFGVKSFLEGAGMSPPLQLSLIGVFFLDECGSLTIVVTLEVEKSG
jgi:hypothetical protein